MNASNDFRKEQAFIVDIKKYRFISRKEFISNKSLGKERMAEIIYIL